MIITTKLNETQLKQVHNLILNCKNKMEMFDHLITIGVNAFHSIHMSNSFEKQLASYSSIITKKEYYYNSYYQMIQEK